MCIRYVTKPANFALTKGFCSCVSCNLFVVVWNSPSRAELRTRIDDLSEAEEYVVFVSVCSGQMCSCNFSVSKTFLGGFSAVTTKSVKPVCNGRMEKRKALQHDDLIRSPSPSLNCVCVEGGAGRG